MKTNPYAAPVTVEPLPNADKDDARIRRLISDRRHSVTSFIAFVISWALCMVVSFGPILAICGIGILVGFLVCVMSTTFLIFRMSGPIGGMFLFVALCFPVVNLLVYAVVLHESAHKIRKHGYEVDLFGVIQKRPVPMATLVS